MIESALDECHADPYDRESLECLARRVSPDFATLYFVARLYELPVNGGAQNAFLAKVAQLSAAPSGRVSASSDAVDSYVLAFVPGFAYKKDRTTGADFASQRAILNEHGFRTLLIETDELGSVESNADVIARVVDHLTEHEDRIILVSAPAREARRQRSHWVQASPAGPAATSRPGSA